MAFDFDTALAYRSLRAALPTWEMAMAATDDVIADQIRSGGLADIKARRIRQALIDIHQRLGDFDLSFLADLPVGEARAWLPSLYGVVPKTVSCESLFSLDRPAMPDDSHVHRVAPRLGLIPGASLRRTGARPPRSSDSGTQDLCGTHAPHPVWTHDLHRAPAPVCAVRSRTMLSSGQRRTAGQTGAA